MARSTYATRSKEHGKQKNKIMEQSTKDCALHRLASSLCKGPCICKPHVKARLHIRSPHFLGQALRSLRMATTGWIKEWRSNSSNFLNPKVECRMSQVSISCQAARPWPPQNTFPSVVLTASAQSLGTWSSLSRVPAKGCAP